MGVIDYFSDFIKKRKAAEASEWIQSRAGEIKPNYQGITSSPSQMDKDIIEPRVRALRKRTGESPPNKSASSLAKWLRIPRIMQEK